MQTPLFLMSRRGGQEAPPPNQSRVSDKLPNNNKLVALGRESRFVSDQIMGCAAGGTAEQLEAAGLEQTDQQGEPEGMMFEEKQPPQSCSSRVRPCPPPTRSPLPVCRVM